MDNAMVKRGIGAVVLAVIAALLLGYLLKDKSRERQDAVEIKIPDAPSLSNTSQTITEGVSNTTATIVNETSEAVSNAGSTVTNSVSNGLDSLSTGAQNTFDAVSEGASSVAASVNSNTSATLNGTDVSNPGFSFRPPAENEEQQINTSSSTSNSTNVDNGNTASASSQNNTVVASTNNAPKKVVKTFKPRIEKEKKVVKKKKQPVKKVANTAGGKYSIQLLATSSQSRASKLAQTFKNEGYVSYITQTTSNNKILYRVRVGGHKDRDTAIKAQQSMQRRYQKNFFVQNSLVVSKK